jgi:energy-converting hydrogenase Eha subunit C
MKGNQTMKLRKNDAGALAYIQMGIVILIMSALAVPIVFSVIGAISPATIDTQLQTALGKGTGYKPAANATAAVLTTAGTVLTLNPLAALVAVAAGMISLLVGAFVVTTGRQGI